MFASASGSAGSQVTPAAQARSTDPWAIPYPHRTDWSEAELEAYNKAVDLNVEKANPLEHERSQTLLARLTMPEDKVIYQKKLAGMCRLTGNFIMKNARERNDAFEYDPIKRRKVAHRRVHDLNDFEPQARSPPLSCPRHASDRE